MIDQAVEFLERAKLDRHLADLMPLAMALDALFEAHLHLSGQGIGELFLDAAHVARFFFLGFGLHQLKFSPQ